MSGGSMNYLCFSLAEAVGKMQDPELDELVEDLSAGVEKILSLPELPRSAIQNYERIPI